jgi:diadenylate cyclase
MTEKKENIPEEIKSDKDALFVPEKDNPSELEKGFTDILKMFAPGTSLRMALDDLLRARMGALIIFNNEKVEKIIDGGFRIDMKFSPQKLVELCKMDGAIVLSKEGKDILYANVLLIPDSSIPSRETGTRHKSAERAAKDANTLVIAVSERKNKISIYYGEQVHELRGSAEIFRRCSETLQILEKQRELFNALIADLNLMEIEKLVTLNDVCSVLRRSEIIRRISQNIKTDLVELGKEGRIVSLRLKELIVYPLREEELILRDYFGQNHLKLSEDLSQLNFDILLEDSDISVILFDDITDRPLSPTGLRLLSKISFFENYTDLLMKYFKILDNILFATDEELLSVLKDEELVSFFKKQMAGLKEKIILGKHI